MVDLILGQFLPYIVGILAALGGMFFYGRKQYNRGKEDVARDLDTDDRNRAARTKKEVDNALDDARATPALDRLRRQDRLRDADED